MSKTLSQSLIIEGIKALREQKYTVGPGQEYSKVRDLPAGGYKMDSSFTNTLGMAGDPFTRTATRTKDISDTDEFVSRPKWSGRNKNTTVYTSRGIFGDNRTNTRNTRQSGRGDPMTMKDVSKIRIAAGSGTLKDRLRALIPGKGSNYALKEQDLSGIFDLINYSGKQRTVPTTKELSASLARSGRQAKPIGTTTYRELTVPVGPDVGIYQERQPGGPQPMSIQPGYLDAVEKYNQMANKPWTTRKPSRDGGGGGF